MEQTNERSPRRNFLGTLAGGAALLGLAAVSPIRMMAQAGGQKPATKPSKSPADLWFDKVKGSHRVVYDAPHPHEVMPFAWARVFLMTNEATGTLPADCGVVVVLRHSAIGYAMTDEMWSKYGFAELFQAKDHGPALQAA